MRTRLVGLLLGAWPSVAAAEPTVAATPTGPTVAATPTGPTVAATPTGPSAYLGGGVVAGVVYNGARSGVDYGAFELEGGMRLGDSRVWAHGVLGQGEIADAGGGGGSNDYLTMRVGFEAPVCSPQRALCLLVGIDVGVRHQRLMNDQLDATDVVVVQRGGIDFGTAHFRVRPTADFVFGLTGFGVGLALTSAYEW